MDSLFKNAFDTMPKLDEKLQGYKGTVKDNGSFDVDELMKSMGNSCFFDKAQSLKEVHESNKATHDLMDKQEL